MRLADRFPTTFRFGAATAAYQIEGAVEADGRGRSIWDTQSHAPGRVAGGDTGDVACDHYRRVDEDVALMVELGLDTYRFSVAWPRVVPDGDGAIERRGLAFYRRLVDRLAAVGIEPVLTLYHWDLPQPLQDRGGWANRATVDAFVRYAEVVQDALGDRVTCLSTLNEPWCSAFLGYGSGEHAPGLADPRASLRAAHHLLLAHGEATRRMRQAAGDAHELGIVLNLVPVVTVGDDAADHAAASRIDGLQNRLFLDPLLRGELPSDVREIYDRFGASDVFAPGDLERIAEPIDVLGVNYYTRHHVGAAPEPILEVGSAYPGCEDALHHGPTGPTTAMGWGIEPEGLRDLLLRLRDEYDLPPVMICENGAAFEDVPDEDGRVHDPERIDYLDRHLGAVADAIDAGVHVRAYHVWSLLDNFEWAFGYSRRFGIVAVDYRTQRRTVKSSGRWYGDLLAQHREGRTSQTPAGTGPAATTTAGTRDQ